MIYTTVIDKKVEIYLSEVEQPYIIDIKDDPVGENNDEKKEWIIKQMEKLISSTRPLCDEEKILAASCLKAYVGYKGDVF